MPWVACELCGLGFQRDAAIGRRRDYVVCKLCVGRMAVQLNKVPVRWEDLDPEVHIVRMIRFYEYKKRVADGQNPV